MEEIVQRLDAIEKECGVTILYACAAGSRAWGMDSSDSDYVDPQRYRASASE